jgi:hypothetical protein
MKEIVGFASFPLAKPFINTASRDHSVNVRVEVKLSAIGMQHHGRPYFSTEMSRIETECFQGADNTPEQKIIGEFLMVIHQRSQFVRHSEGDHKIGHRQEFFLLLVYPLTGCMVLTLWAMTITTGDWPPF